MKRVCICILTIAASSAIGDVVDDFEGYETGSLPGGGWLDAAEFIENSTIQNPSATVVDTVDVFGNPTQAVQIDPSGIGTSGGIASRVDHSQVQRFETDLRIDQLGNGNYPNWTYAAGFFQETDQNDLIRMPQAVIYSLNNSRRFRLYIHNADGNGGLTRDLVLGTAEYELDSWYRISLEVDTASGVFQSTVVDLASGEEVVSVETTITNWNAEFGQYDLISVNDGEYGTNVGTLGNGATIDNIRYTPAPGSLALLVSAGMLVSGRKRRD